jgi:hypothetical protein
MRPTFSGQALSSRLRRRQRPRGHGLSAGVAALDAPARLHGVQDALGSRLAGTPKHIDFRAF